MEIGLLTPARRWLFLIAVLLVVATVALLAAKNALADHWAQSELPEDWLQAAHLGPGNADYWYRLGQYRQSDLEPPDLALA